MQIPFVHFGVSNLAITPNNLGVIYKLHYLRLGHNHDTYVTTVSCTFFYGDNLLRNNYDIIAIFMSRMFCVLAY